MRPSPLRHPVAVLRTSLGLTQKELGGLVHRAARTIQAVELGTLPLGEGLACRIAEATGIDVGWLLEGDPTLPARRADGSPYVRADYERHRARLEAPPIARRIGEVVDREMIAGVEHLLHATAGTSGGDLVRWKLRRMLTALAAEHGDYEENDSRK